jgi:integrase
MSIGRPKNSPYYHYDFRIQGHRFRGSTGEATERQARAFERAEKERRRAEIRAGVTQANNPTIAGVFVRYWEAEGHKKRWAYGIQKHMEGMLAHFGKGKLFGDIGNADVAGMLEAYEASTERNNRKGKNGKVTTRPGKPTPSTVNRRLAVLRRIYNKARVEWELPVKAINWKAHTRDEPKERVRHTTVEQAKTLLDRLPHNIMLMVAWSLATGCRLNETETLTWERVNFETRQAEVLTKGGGTRFVTLGPDALAVLAQVPKIGGFVFDKTNRRKLWEAAVKAAGLEDFRWHDLRHSFAVWVGNAGADIAVVQQLLGHSKIETTLRYRKVITGERVRAVEGLPTLIEGTVVPMKRKEAGDGR